MKSLKGKRHGVKDEKRRISNLKIAVIAQNRNGSVIARIAGRGRPKDEEIDTKKCSRKDLISRSWFNCYFIKSIILLVDSSGRI